MCKLHMFFISRARLWGLRESPKIDVDGGLPIDLSFQLVTMENELLFIVDITIWKDG